MRYSAWEQRQMDIKSGEEEDRHSRKAKLAQPCKNKGFTEVDGIDGSCLRCGAIQGEACRPLEKMAGAQFDPRNYSEEFPSAECRKAFEAYNGTRVGQSAAEWNEIKRIFISGWNARGADQSRRIASA